MTPDPKTEAAQGPAHAPGLRRLRHFAVIWGFIRRYRGHLMGAGVSLLIAAATTLAIPLALRLVVDKGFGADNLAAVDRYFLLMLALAVVLAIFTALRFYFVTWIGERVVADVRVAVQSHLLTLSPAFFEENRPSEIASRLTADTTLIQSVVGSSASIALRNLITGLGGIAVMAYLSPQMTGMILLGIPVIVLPIVFLGRKLRNLSRSSQDRVADIGAMADEVLGALRVVQAYTQEPRERDRFSRAVESAFATAKRRVRVRSTMTAIVILLIFGGITLFLWHSARGVATGAVSGGTIAAFVLVAALVAGALGALTEVYGELMRAAGAAGRLAELMQAEVQVKAPAQPLSLPSPVVGAIRFDGVTFHYPTKPDAPALEGFNLDIRAGETVALVGPSGAGKTTLFQLIQRFYDPQAGRVLLDGVDIAQVEPRSLRAHMALVPQETVIFAASAYENILYGRPDASDDEVWQAAKAAAADGFLRALPDGIDTYLGEQGTRLSGGQRQRIAIARAILRDAPILLLDEATSALDAESERLVQSALDRLMQGRTTLVIAHRLATVLKADRIVVMEAGRIVAEGRHEELMRADGLYRRLAALQFDEGSGRAAE